MKEFLFKISVFIFSACIVATSTLNAQDVHFSQFANSPLHLNPALTGIFDGTARISNTYRSQWSSFGNGYKTIMLSGDMPIGKKINKNNHFGVGAMIYQDKAGTAGYKSTVIEGSLSYITGFSDQNKSFFSLGFQGGLNQQAIDLNKATWDSQWNGDEFDPALPTGESIQLQQFTYLDLNAGVLYYYIPNENNSFNIGAAMSHIGSPNVSFYTEEETPMRSKVTVHTGGEIVIDKNDETWFNPRAMFTLQGNQKEIIAGGHFKRKVQFKSRYTNYKKEAYFYAGGFYRLEDAFVVSFRFEFNTLGLGISYDVNTSTLSKLAGASNAFEINLAYIPYIKRGSKAKNVNRIPRFL